MLTEVISFKFHCIMNPVFIIHFYLLCFVSTKEMDCKILTLSWNLPLSEHFRKHETRMLLLNIFVLLFPLLVKGIKYQIKQVCYVSGLQRLLYLERVTDL